MIGILAAWLMVATRILQPESAILAPLSGEGNDSVALSRQFDSLFSRYRGRLPVNYLRALSYSESRMNPSDTGGSYWGLMQVGYKSVLPSYNRRRGTSYSPRDLLNADVNVKIGTDLLNRIIVAYGKHPSPNMRPSGGREFWKLLTAGWNSGYSESGGVGKVAAYLEQRGIPVTHDNVFRYAAAAGATVHLQNDAKRAWQAAVVDRFYDEGGPGPGWMTFILVAGVGYAFYKTLTR
jgi:soluble lytic murein transglycosylase-like protein